VGVLPVLKNGDLVALAYLPKANRARIRVLRAEIRRHNLAELVKKGQEQPC
jgi:hypothetical protein